MRARFGLLFFAVSVLVGVGVVMHASTPSTNPRVQIAALPFSVQLPPGWQVRSNQHMPDIVAWYAADADALYPNFNVFLYQNKAPVPELMRGALRQLRALHVSSVRRRVIGDYPFLITQSRWVHPKLGALRALRAAAMLDQGVVFMTCVAKVEQSFAPCAGLLRSLQALPHSAIKPAVAPT